MDWYKEKNNLAEAIGFVMKYNCVFGWTSFASGKTPCADYKKIDEEIPEELREAIQDYISGLTTQERRNLNREFSYLLGERFFTRETSIVRILSRILCEGNPCENKEIIESSLQTQIKQRRDLLDNLRRNDFA